MVKNSQRKEIDKMKWYRAAIARKYYATTALIFCEMGRELSFRHFVSFELGVIQKLRRQKRVGGWLVKFLRK